MSNSKPGKCFEPNCSNLASSMCGQCRSVRYCSLACQQRHWNVHKLKCKNPKKRCDCQYCRYTKSINLNIQHSEGHNPFYNSNTHGLLNTSQRLSDTERTRHYGLLNFQMINQEITAVELVSIQRNVRRQARSNADGPNHSTFVDSSELANEVRCEMLEWYRNLLIPIDFYVIAAIEDRVSLLPTVLDETSEQIDALDEDEQDSGIL